MGEAWEKQAGWAKTVKFLIAEKEYLSQKAWEREEVERNMMFDSDDRLLAHMAHSMHHPCVGLMFELLPPWVEEVCSSDPKALAAIKEIRANFEEGFKKNHGHPEPSFLEALD